MTARRRTSPHLMADESSDRSRGIATGAGVRSKAVRVSVVLGAAASEGLIGREKNARIGGRVSRALIEAAKARSHLVSDSELIEYALAKVAIEDDFGEYLVSRRGAIGRDVDLED